jgi:hypothetical protein
VYLSKADGIFAEKWKANFWHSKGEKLMLSINKALLVFGLTIFVLGFYVLGNTTAKENESVAGVFEGITPCTNVNPPVPQITPDNPCEMMRWHLVLNQDAETGYPTTYTLMSAYGMSQSNSTGMAQGGIRLDLKGSWTVTHGAAHDPDATVYQLNPETPEQAISFIKISDHLLHVLSQDSSLMVGMADGAIR